MLPLVTIMIPTYNQADIVHRAIESALAQDYSNLEVVVSDDGSPDNTSEVVRKYMHDARFRYFRNDKNLGRVRNYKKCLEEYATGEWVVNCDGDDYYTDNRFISEMMDLIRQHQEKKIVFAQGGKLMTFSHKVKPNLPDINDNYKIITGEDYFFSRIKDTFFSHMTTLYKRKLAISIDFYRSNISSSDKESFYRLALHGDVLLVKKPYGNWIGHGENFSQKSDIDIVSGNSRYIESVCKYAEQYGYPFKVLKIWRNNMMLKYFSDWINKIVSSNNSISSKLLDIKNLLRFIWCNYRDLFKKKLMLYTILKLPVKFLYFSIMKFFM